MMLLFLGSWRSTLIVMISIPLSLLVSVVVLDRFGQTLNSMTLGGMALAVGILVDDATVALENYHLQRSQKKPVGRAILDGAAEIAAATLVSTLCICIVFVPVVLIAGAARSLFVPLAMAVVFAMLTSYFLSRTLVPTLISYLLANEEHGAGRGPIAWLSARVERGFERLREAYARALEGAIRHRKAFIASFVAFVAASLCLVPFRSCQWTRAEEKNALKLGKTIDQLKSAPEYKRPVQGFVTTDQMKSADSFFGSEKGAAPNPQ
jgi:multidrug efflux pump subunit AcrB